MIALRQNFQRIAGADDDGGAVGGTGRCDRARRDAGRGFEPRLRPAARRRQARARRRTRQRWRTDRTAARKPRAAAATRTDRRAGNIATARGVRPEPAARAAAARCRSIRPGNRTDWPAATTCRRCNPRPQRRSAPAPQDAERGASQERRQHGTWLLTRTQQMTFLSKHVPSKQPLKPPNKVLAAQPIRKFTD